VPTQRPLARRLRLVLGVLVGFLVLAVLSVPFLAAGANNRLEQRCSMLATWTYDRSHRVPVFWTCTGRTYDGEMVTLKPW
jgi:hypothetical protein